MVILDGHIEHTPMSQRQYVIYIVSQDIQHFIQYHDHDASVECTILRNAAPWYKQKTVGDNWLAMLNAGILHFVAVI